MNFRIRGIDETVCNRFFQMSEEELAANNAKKIVVEERYSAPCRLSLTDCVPGDEVVAFNYFHHNVCSPYRGFGPVFVKLNAKKVFIADNTLPELVLDDRRFSIRSYDASSVMVTAEVVLGRDIKAYIDKIFLDKRIAYSQVHFAASGCWIFDLLPI